MPPLLLMVGSGTFLLKEGGCGICFVLFQVGGISWAVVDTRLLACLSFSVVVHPIEEASQLTV